MHLLESVEDQIESELELALSGRANRLRHVLIDVIGEVGVLVSRQLADELLDEVS